MPTTAKTYGSLTRRKSAGIRLDGNPNASSMASTPANNHVDAKDERKSRFRHLANQSTAAKLGTFAGVFVPTSLNVLSILMFLRFGFILGQSGVLGMMGMLVACYAIDLLTTMSVSAIATNGTVRGGGAYYLISRSLGPEFGGAIGIVFYLGCVLNTGLNAVGFVDCLTYNFGIHTGGWSNWLPDGFWWSYFWATAVLVICTAICMAGSSLFAKASNGLLVILLIATFSIPLSTLVLTPFKDAKLGIEYTGLSFDTFKSNLLPNLTTGANGSQMSGKETWQDLFGVLFPATSGIFAGASMSGDLKHPSKAIPKGTLYGLVLTFGAYTLVILAMAASVTRASFYRNVNIVQDVNISGGIILLGEFATSFFSALMGVIGSAKLLQALARDNLIPGFTIFGQGSKAKDEPHYAILITHIVAQLTMLANINQIASLITMAYLMTFLVTNLACFLLKIGSAPNFRPSFRYFSWETAALGTLVSCLTMFYVDGIYASACVAVLIALFLIIHYTSPPKSWGDVSQSLIYHQVRKYLLRLRQDHVKFWRPSVLLFINDPRRQFKLIQFCNSMKKGALFIIAHVIVTDDFSAAVPEARRQQASWTKYIDFSKIKAFINIAVSPGVEWGARNIVLNSGLGGMRPNIVILGFFNLNDLRMSKPLIDIPSPQPSRPSSVMDHREPDSTVSKKAKHRRENHRLSLLPTDENRPEGSISAQTYVTILEDMLLNLKINVAIAKGFQDLELPGPKQTYVEKVMSWIKAKAKVDEEEEEEQDEEQHKTKYIDMWPVQMSAEIESGGDDKRNILTTNFDTYTLILQLGCILNTVSSWERTFKLRVSVFVEYESDVEEERRRVTSLLFNLRIKADVRVFWLASGTLKTYEVIVNGRKDDEFLAAFNEVDEVLEDEEWWADIQAFHKQSSTQSDLAELENTPILRQGWQKRSSKIILDDTDEAYKDLRKMLRKGNRKKSFSGLNEVQGEMRVQLSSLNINLLERHPLYDSASESSSSSEEEDLTDSDSDGRAASENDADEVFSHDQDQIHPRSRSFQIPPINRTLGSLRGHGRAKSPTKQQLSPSKFAAASASDTALVDGPPLVNAQSGQSSGTPSTPRKPPTVRQQSLPKFTSRPVPPTRVATEEGPGPSIMFEDPPVPNKGRSQGASVLLEEPESISESMHEDDSTTPTASGFPAQQALPLTFNDLPSRAQHLILNELMLSNSGQTAVLFTTLPGPAIGTSESQEDCIRYLSDLEVLCQNLPPILLVHSNTVTVTMSL